MRNVNIRIIAAKGVKPTHIATIKQGLVPFTQYGVLVETKDATDPYAFKGIRAGTFLKRILNGKEVTIPENDRMILQAAIDTLLGRHVLGFAITNEPLKFDDAPAIGKGNRFLGAILSLDQLLKLPVGQQSSAIKLSVQHEMGHAFGLTHCATRECTMEMIPGISALERALGLNQTGFCGLCTTTVSQLIAGTQIGMA